MLDLLGLHWSDNSLFLVQLTQWLDVRRHLDPLIDQHQRLKHCVSISCIFSRPACVRSEPTNTSRFRLGSGPAPQPSTSGASEL